MKDPKIHYLVTCKNFRRWKKPTLAKAKAEAKYWDRVFGKGSTKVFEVTEMKREIKLD